VSPLIMPETAHASSTVSVSIQRLPHGPEQLPGYATPGSAGMDIAAAIDSPITLKPMERTLVPTGLIMAIPEGYECQLRARSGLAIKHGISLINGIGTIDSDYRHEVKVALVNLSTEPFTIQPGDRVAQAVFAPVTQAILNVVTSLELVEGRNGGFGSTGIGKK